MGTIDLKYLVTDRDRHGNLRRYVRAPGKRKVRIRVEPSDPSFSAAYAAALAGSDGKPSLNAKPGSFRFLCNRYFGSEHFLDLDESTRRWQRRALEKVCEKHGHKPVALLEPHHILGLRNELTRAAANQRLKAIRAMFAWAFEAGEVKSNPTVGVKRRKYVTKGHHTLTEEEIAQYEARHPLGTKPRLAFDILRFTTGRREDAVRFGRGNIKNGRVKFRQAKNEHRNPIDIDMPLDPRLKASIAACPSGHMTFLVTQYGKPYSPAGFGNAMRDWFNQANLPHCSAHSVRKATPTQMAEKGATPHELMAITGHTTLEQVEVYTKAANKKRLADSAMRKFRR